MKRLVLFNPAQATLNLGDEIIVEACLRQLNQLFPVSQYVSLSTHQPLGVVIPWYVKNSDYRFVCGTNLLKSGMFFRARQPWQISIKDTWFVRDTILLGCGWWQYQKSIDPYSKLLWRRVMSKQYIHSVRDEYTREKLSQMGITNVVNTGCPTMWELSSQHCETIPETRAQNVVTTLTDYNENMEADSTMINILSQNYKYVYVWPQGYNDSIYFKTLNSPKNVMLIGASLKEYDALLKKMDVEYIGTRLHGGIRALQHGRRTLIIGVDNRAIEKKRDFNLNVMQRSELVTLPEYIYSDYKTKIKIDTASIELFKNQFH